LKNAKATICASTFLEPFCGVQIESMLSGTPVISSDWGAFGEYNAHGLTGYRCKTFEQFEWAAHHVGDLDPYAIRRWAEKFSLQNVAPHYTDYFKSVADIFSGRGWYEPNDSRKSLDSASFSQFTR
jgi:glycosyltransferase involved in cell wall biosynthesis